MEKNIDKIYEEENLYDEIQAKIESEAEVYGEYEKHFIAGAEWMYRQYKETIKQKIEAQFFETIANQNMNLAHAADLISQQEARIKELMERIAELGSQM